MIQTANKMNRKIGICGQAPSDSAEFAKFLAMAGINSISFNADALLNGIKNINSVLKNDITEQKNTYTS
jgi:pyruvate,water dikinase